MRGLAIAISLISATLLTLTPQAQGKSCCGGEGASQTCEKHATVDIFNGGAGDFLDVDLNERMQKAYEAYTTRDYEQAARSYLDLLRYNIRDGGSIYNLACCYGLMGKDTLAAEYLLRAFKAGFEDLEHAKRDPDFENVRGKKVFDAAVDSIGSILEERRKDLGTTLHVTGEAFLRCHVRVPAGFDSVDTVPLVIGLHGYGADPEGFMGLFARFDDPGFIFASPQAPYAFSTGERTGYSWHKWEVGSKATALSSDYVVRVALELRKAYNISSIYLLGFSQGCAQTYITGIQNSNLFEGLICFGGWLDTDHLTDEMLAKSKNLRVFIAHATDDRVVDFEAGTKARDVLEKHGYDVAFHQFEGGHRVPQEPLRAAQKWMVTEASD